MPFFRVITKVILHYLLAENNIHIQLDKQPQGNWLSIFIPQHQQQKNLAVITNEQGETLKRVNLQEGNNSVDISTLTDNYLHIKVETQQEIILKKIKIN